ncbi:hypothetical protein HJ588_09995 [Flexivirga sp. ID2601S]|uniref:DUF6891 domain-containing protein n=1 Tax=Flexivirga aerilata TaxID=1656889 RepID=A0A849AMM0_9MICO|nr:hypothetical protein [Flexivirga aerilata]NNG39600.1 hypothetical protein [Flexivirga aerilata]
MTGGPRDTDPNFAGTFRPDLDTAVGRVMVRICIGTDSRAALVERMRWEIGQDAELRAAGLTDAVVPDVIDRLIDEHNTHVTEPSPSAVGLITGLDRLTEDGIVFGFGEGYGVHDSLDGVIRAAQTLLDDGHPVDGYCFSTVADVERMIFEQRLYVGFGVFNEHGEGSTAIGERIAGTFRAQGLQVRWPGTSDHRIQVLGAYAIPYVDLPQ